MAKPKPDPNDPDNKAHADPSTNDNCRRCGGSGKEMINGLSYDCRSCGGSGRR